MSDSVSTSDLLACRRGDDRAAHRIYAHTVPRLRAIAVAMLKDAAAADDAVQATILRLFDTPRKTIRRVRSPDAWLITILRRQCLQMMRSEQRETARRQHHSDTAPSAVDEHSTRDVQHTLQSHIQRLSQSDRELLILKHVGSLTFEQMALVLDDNRNTIASRYQSAIRRIREMSNCEFANSSGATHAR